MYGDSHHCVEATHKVKRTMHEQEELWVKQAQAGSKPAFSHLVDAYQRPVYNLTYRMLGNAQEAEDAAQETFLRAYARLGQYDSSHKFSTWILSIANHHCIDRLRKRRSGQVSIDDNPVLQNLEEESPQPEMSVLDQEQAVELQELIKKLEPEYRTPLILRYWEDYSYEQIAEVMGLTVAAVKSRLFRARKQVADLYRESQVVTSPPSAGMRYSTPSAATAVKSDSQRLMWRTVWAGV
ncbi:MAG TPA: sigma-70 family RNA polymerase sigma factor [Caldilineaceae bacterium]|nr:sigma-70 family RNA polymerase sigma factor [Caldilineaceae bacterium]